MANSNDDGFSRRSVLKSSVAGAAAFSAPWLFSRRCAEALQPGTTQHPEVDGLRAIGVHDPRMIDGRATNIAWDRQDAMVKTGVVQENMDKMACVLTEETDPSKAWRRIFLKPPGKGWSDVVVAFKCNQNAQQHGHSAVVAKLCHVLTDLIGVKAHNIHLYDACHGKNMPERTPYKGLPEGINLESRWGGYNVKVDVPAPYKGGSGQLRCLDPLAKGKIDILVNIGVCRGTLYEFGAFSQATKNHFGTFNPKPAHAGDGGGDYLVSINKAPAILGETDPKTGKVLFPREQLTVLDALWSAEKGPGGVPPTQSSRLYMGTFGPVLDYQVATEFRRDTMGWRINEDLTKRLLSDYGFSESDLPGDGKIIDALEQMG